MTSTERPKLFVGGLTVNHTESTLEKYCSKWGKLKSCFIKRSPAGYSRGFGFVTFKNIEEMKMCLEQESHILDNINITFKKAVDMKPKVNGKFVESFNPQSSDLKRLFIGNLHYSVTRTDIFSYFSKFGYIRSISMPNKTRQSRKYAMGVP